MSKKIKLTQGKYAIVDNEDFEWLSHRTWYYDHGYARRNYGGRISKKSVYLHQQIMGTKKGVDHINGNGLDNRRKNLRLATQKENLKNVKRHKDTKSKTKGVYKRTDKRPKMWYSRIMVDGKDINLGHFLTKEEAKVAYANASKKYHGEFGRTK